MQKLEHPPEGEVVIWIGDLAEIVNRRKDTIRGWVSKGLLPETLHPKMGYKPGGKKPIRYWTNAQVYAKGGILSWMQQNDMRPGRAFADPADEARHIANLRRPKYLNGYHIRSLRTWCNQGKDWQWIINKLYPRTNYTTKAGLERAVRQIAQLESIKLPRKIDRRFKDYKEPRVPTGLAALARQAEKADKLTSKKIKRKSK